MNLSITQIPAGGGRIVASLHGSRVVFLELSSTYPLKLLSPQINQDRVAVVYILSYGGGLVGGDYVALSVDVQRGVRLVLLSQGSTKVFKFRSGQRLATVRTDPSPSSSDYHPISDASSTTQSISFSVASTSTLLLLPDPVTCFQNASYNQLQRFNLSKDASIVVLDWITSGRKSIGEEWAFSRYYSANEIWLDGKRIAKDVMLLDESHDPVPHRTLGDKMAPYSCYAMVILYGPSVQDIINSVTVQYTHISVFKQKSPENLIWSLSPISPDGSGAIMRVAGTETETVKKWLQQALGGIEDIVGTEVYRRVFA